MTVEQFDDASFLKTSNKWPCYPLCPVKGSGFPQIGFVMAAKPTVVWLANMIAAIEGEVDLDAIGKKEYATIEDLVAEWLVD